MKVYLDACCLGRLTDDQTQLRVRNEAEAVELVFSLIARGSHEWVASEALAAEIGRNPSLERRIECQALLSIATSVVLIDDSARSRALALEKVGYGAFDALHLAAAESAGVDVLLSTDDRFIRLALRGVGGPKVQVQNPVSWVRKQRS